MNLKDKIEKLLDSSVLFTDEQKESWLDLLPKMNEDELLELHAILADEVSELKKEGIELISDRELEAELVQTSSDASHGASLATMKAAVKSASDASASRDFAQELKREITTPELLTPMSDGVKLKSPLTIPKPPLAVPLAPLPDSLTKLSPEKSYSKTTPSLGLKSLMDIRTVDDLKKVQTEHLRQGELQAQVDLIKAKIFTLAQTNKILPFYTVAAFEESPLYKTYLTIGSAMITDGDPNRAEVFQRAAAKTNEALTVREFEAIADLRKQIEQL